MREVEFRSKLKKQLGLSFPAGAGSKIICPYHKGGEEQEPSLSYFKSKKGKRNGKWLLRCFAEGCPLNLKPLSEDDFEKGKYTMPGPTGRDKRAEEINRIAWECAGEIPFTLGGKHGWKNGESQRPGFSIMTVRCLDGCWTPGWR